MTVETEPVRRTYGGWIPVRSPGIAGLSLAGTAIGGVVLTATFLTVVVIGVIAGLVVFIFGLLVFVTFGTPIGVKVGRRSAFQRSAFVGETHWRSGIFGRTKHPQMRLPGTVGKSTLVTKQDPFGTPFVTVVNPAKSGFYTIVARCEADGPAMQDQNTIDLWVADWGGTLGAIGHDPAVVCVKAITDTAPDTGGRLAASVEADRSPQAPVLASEIIDECVATYPGAAAENVTYVEVTFKGRALSSKGNREHILSELSRRVPGLIARLEAAGGGAVEMVNQDELPAIVRVGYDPNVQASLEATELSGLQSSEPISWASAGPVAATEYWDRYLHDSGMSVTFEMSEPPRSAVTEMVLVNLLAPHSDFRRKRLALIHRPHSALDSYKQSERDLDVATFVTGQSRRKVSARDTRVIAAADKARNEVADGAVLSRFSLLVTITVDASGGDLDQAVSTLTTAAGAVNLRRTYGSQAAAFAATLPIGVVPWEMTTIPDSVRRFAN